MSDKIWIDTTTGTWGEVAGDSGRLMIVDLDIYGGFDHDHDAYSLLAALDSMDDGEIAQYGRKYGSPAVPLPTQAQFDDAIETVVEAIAIGRAGTAGQHTGAGLMFKILGRLGLVDLPAGLL